MAGHICPWWGGYFIDNRLRRWLHNPEKIVGPYIRPGMTVMDLGCGMGIFSIDMARMVGETGLVIAVDLQQEMLDVLTRRSRKAGVSDRIRTHRARPALIGLETPVDFALAFAMLHETPDARSFLEQIYRCLQPGGRLLVAEPQGHVRRRAFQSMLVMAEELGFVLAEQPRIRLSHAAVLRHP